MKTLKIKNTDIVVPKGQSGVYETAPELPKAHGIFVAVARRKGGKSVAVSNLARMMDFDRVFLISPTATSNKAILDPLGIDTGDVFEDLEDKNIINNVIEKINQERDEYELYLEQIKEYKKFLKMLNEPTTMIPDEMLLQFYTNGLFQPPKHKWGGRKPKMALIVDDAQNSKVFSGKMLPNLCIKHRHYGQLKEGNALGLSVFIMAQNFKCVSGGLPKPVRGNATGWMLFKNFNETEKKFVAEELAIDNINKDDFISMWDNCCDSAPHTFLFVDMDKKAHHQSAFRKNFNEFIIPPK
jgi:hypothetical protein